MVELLIEKAIQVASGPPVERGPWVLGFEKAHLPDNAYRAARLQLVDHMICGGMALKRVGSQARREIEAFIGRPVYLELRVKVAEAWRKDDRFIRDNVYGRE